MSTTAVIPNGTYFINSRRLEEIYLRFADGSSRLTTWHFSGGEDQQVCCYRSIVTLQRLSWSPVEGRWNRS